MDVHTEEAFEVVRGGSGPSPIVLSCEHASNRMPAPWAWPDDDRWIVETHWAYDIGAAELTRSLAEALGATAVLARYSRLLIDANRALTAPNLFRDVAEGLPVHINVDVADDDAAERIERYWRPYHTALEAVIRESPGAAVLAMHSFTPVYEGDVRQVEIGVLYDRDETEAVRIAEALDGSGFEVRLNEPYSGANGMMYSAYRHASEYDRAALELEIRQDICGDLERHPELVDVIVKALRRAGVLRSG